MSRSKYNNKERAYVLNNGLNNEVASILAPMDKWGRVVQISDWRLSHNGYDCAMKLYTSRKRKTQRIKDKIETMLLHGEQPIFLTLSFKDEVLAKTNEKTRRRYVARFLKENACTYVANIDFGDDYVYVDDYGKERKATSREHYHALVDKSIDYSKWHKYGFIKGEKVHDKKDDYIALRKYLTKFTKHAIKVMEKCENYPRLIFSRNMAD